MGKVSSFPQDTGVNPWYETAVNKDHQYADISKVEDVYDYVIVGAGFGGISAAYRLYENDPTAKIAVFDALKVGTFSSGRNAGFMEIDQISGSLIGFNSYTLEDQKMLNHLNAIIGKRVTDYIEKNKLKLDFAWDGMYHGIREARNDAALMSLAKSFEEVGIEYELFEGKALAERLGTDFYTKALYLKGCALNNPSELIRGLAAALPSNISVFENTKILEVSEGQEPYVVLENGKKIHAKKVILTVAAFIRHFGFKQKEIAGVCSISSFGAMTRELTDEEFAPFKDIRPWGLVATHPAGATVRFTSKRRVFVRTDLAYQPKQHLNIDNARFDQAKPILREAFEKRWPSLKNVPFEYEYGGLVAFTGNAMPLFGEVAPNIYAGCTCEGAGVVRASILGTYLADLIQGVGSSELDYILKRYHPGYLPPEVFRTVGANAFIWWKNSKAGSEM